MGKEIPFLSLQRQHASLQEELHAACRRVVDSGRYINGPECDAFARELSETLGLGKVLPVSNGLDAIRLIIRAYIELGRLRKGDEVILPANTYIASLLPVTEMGLTPVLVEHDPSTFGLDWKKAEKAVTHRTRALITVHLYGTPSWDLEIAARLRERDILIIEDNAQAIGAAIDTPDRESWLYTGALGDAAAFSFYPTKNVGALGDAGAVASRDADLIAAARALANYGSTRRYHNTFTGYNCRMDELQAAMLRVKLRHLHDITRRRGERARLYSRLITNPLVTPPAFHDNMTQVWHQYTILSSLRDSLREHLAAHGIATDIHYPLSLFDQECYSAPGMAPVDAGNARESSRRLAREILSLPIADVTEEEINYIADKLNIFHT